MKRYRIGDIVEMNEKGLNQMGWEKPVVGIVMNPWEESLSMRIRIGKITDTWSKEYFILYKKP